VLISGSLEEHGEGKGHDFASQPAVLFSHTNSALATSQPAVFFSHNKSGSATNQ
jgi:hypothetical protein